jgi:hypothetical protein
MMQTFTPSELIARDQKEGRSCDVPQVAEPSALTLQNILNYSRSLEIRPSRLVKEFQVMKS